MPIFTILAMNHGFRSFLDSKMQSIIHNWTNIFTVTEEGFLLAEARETFELLVKTELPLGEDFNLHCGLSLYQDSISHPTEGHSEGIESTLFNFI
jgi:hypothetical protein